MLPDSLEALSEDLRLGEGFMKLKQPESVADFKHRIAIIMRERETGKRYSIIGAARSHPCVVRKNYEAVNKRHVASQITTTAERDKPMTAVQ